jgi:hypothetical protein
MKYYITFGEYKKVYQTSNLYQACMEVFRYYFKDDKHIDSIPKYFRLSQKGFEVHDDDEVVSTKLIIKLIMFNTKYIKKNKI